ncbi:uncharacterized protein LOC110869536 [Helianthus annuus]|uniref:uncharacterized protein LOC110869536 n=1 Tax=Helianthus annuus TaxID=4232 RepID=UPI000B8FE01D|nr:uncharacterized protein LOC110869536 [Helianthus annuus]
MVTSSHPTIVTEAITISVSLTEEAKRMNKIEKKGTEKTKEKQVESVSHDNKWKFSQFRKGSRPSNKKKENPIKKTGKAFVAAAETEPKGYVGNAPKCNRCGYHHTGSCRTIKCDKCGKMGHRTESCWSNNKGKRNEGKKEGGSGNGNERGKNQGCFNCGDMGHFKKDCPKENQGRGRASVSSRGATGSKCDHRADFSFISLEFKDILGLKSIKLDNSFTIELANGKVIESDKIVKGCSLELGGRKFKVDLIPVQLGSFDIVIGMDWLSTNQVEVVCYEKIIRIPLPNNDTLLVHGEKNEMPLRIISCMKARKCLRKGCITFLAHIVDKKAKELKLEEIPVVKEFPEVFSEDLPGLPPQ